MSTFMDDAKKELTALAREHAQSAIAEGDAPVDAEHVTELALKTLRDLAFDPDRLPNGLCRAYVGYYTKAYIDAIKQSY